MHLGESAHVIEPHDVIGVGMGEEGGIQPDDALSQALGAEIRSRIDHEMALGGLD